MKSCRLSNILNNPSSFEVVSCSPNISLVTSSFGKLVGEQTQTSKQKEVAVLDCPKTSYFALSLPCAHLISFVMLVHK